MWLRRLLYTIWVPLVLSMLMPACLLRARDQGQLSCCESNLKNIGMALELYATDHRGELPATLPELCPHYLKTLPICPACGLDSYSSTYRCSANHQHYWVHCQGNAHHRPGLISDEPAYSSEPGLGQISVEPDHLGPVFRPAIPELFFGSGILIWLFFVASGLERWTTVGAGLALFSLITYSASIHLELDTNVQYTVSLALCLVAPLAATGWVAWRSKARDCRYLPAWLSIGYCLSCPWSFSGDCTYPGSPVAPAFLPLLWVAVAGSLPLIMRYVKPPGSAISSHNEP